MAGEEFYFAGSVPPSGSVVRNGQALSRTTYANLFAAIGTTFGAGDGLTTFNVPDDRGESTVGADLGRGIEPGLAVGVWRRGMIPDHVHPNIPSFATAGAAGGAVNVQTGVAASSGGVNSIAGGVSLGSDVRVRGTAKLPCIYF